MIWKQTSFWYSVTDNIWFVERHKYIFNCFQFNEAARTDTKFWKSY